METVAEEGEKVRKQEFVKLVVPPEIDSKTLEIDMGTSVEDGSFNFTGTTTEKKYQGVEGILRAVREGQEVGVSIDSPSNGDVMLIIARGSGKGENRYLSFTITTIYKYSNEKGWHIPQNGLLSLK